MKSGGDDSGNPGFGGVSRIDSRASLQTEFTRTAEAGSRILKFLRRLYRLEFLLRLTHRQCHVSHGKSISQTSFLGQPFFFVLYSRLACILFRWYMTTIYKGYISDWACLRSGAQLFFSGFFNIFDSHVHMHVSYVYLSVRPSVILWRPGIANTSSPLHVFTSHSWYIRAKEVFHTPWYKKMQDTVAYIKTCTRWGLYQTPCSESHKTGPQEMLRAPCIFVWWATPKMIERKSQHRDEVRRYERERRREGETGKIEERKDKKEERQEWQKRQKR